MKNKSVMSLMHAFDYVSLNLNRNATTERLTTHWQAPSHLAKRLRELGFRNLINLTHKNQDAAIAWAFYAGNGTVLKVIPTSFTSKFDTIYHLPAISTHRFSCDHLHSDFVIKTYPYLNTYEIGNRDVENLGEKLKSIGLDYTNGDDAPRNVRRLPDKHGTLVGIDSCMFEGALLDPDLIDEWHNYVHSLFPIYLQYAENPNILRQNDSTDYSFHSAHDPNFRFDSFEDFCNHPDIEKPELNQASEKSSTGFSARFLATLGIKFG